MVSGYHCSCYGKTQPHSHGSKSTCIEPKGRTQNYYPFISNQSLQLTHGALLLLLILCHIVFKYCFIYNWYKEISDIEIIIFSQTFNKTASILRDINILELKLELRTLVHFCYNKELFSYAFSLHSNSISKTFNYCRDRQHEIFLYLIP